MTGTVSEVWEMACPKCGDDQRIDILAEIWVRLRTDGSDPYEAQNQDHTWDDASPAVCNACGHGGTVKQFTVEDRDDA